MTDVPTPIVLKFKSADGEIFETEEDVASVSLLMKGMLEDIRIENDEGKRLMETIPIIPVETKHLKWALEYCELYKNIPYVEQDPRTIQKIPLTNRNEKFFYEIPGAEVHMLLEAAIYLEIPGLVDILAYRIAKYIENMTVEEMRAFFGVENDFTEEEEKEMKERFSWADKIGFQPHNQMKKNKTKNIDKKLL